MNCRDCQDVLQRRLDGAPEGDGPAGLARHLESCAACRDRFAAARRLRTGLALLEAPAPPHGFAGRVVARVLRDHQARALRRRLTRVVAAAACLALAVLAAYALRPSDSGPAPPPRGPVVRDDPPEPSLRDSVAEAQSAVASLTNRTLVESVEQTRLLWPVMAPPLPELPADPPALPPARTLAEARHGVSLGLEPVADSARRAVNLFLRDLPGEETR